MFMSRSALLAVYVEEKGERSCTTEVRVCLALLSSGLHERVTMLMFDHLCGPFFARLLIVHGSEDTSHKHVCSRCMKNWV